MLYYIENLLFWVFCSSYFLNHFFPVNFTRLMSWKSIKNFFKENIKSQGKALKERCLVCFIFHIAQWKGSIIWTINIRFLESLECNQITEQWIRKSIILCLYFLLIICDSIEWNCYRNCYGILWQRSGCEVHVPLVD